MGSISNIYARDNSQGLANILHSNNWDAPDEGVQKINVLVIEDNDTDFELIRRSLRNLEGYTAEVFHAHDVVTVRSLIRKVNFDVALVDYCLGADSGLRAIQEVGGRCGDCAIILVSGMPGHEVSKIALSAGAINHINKNNLSPVLMETTIRSAIHTHSVERQLYHTIVELQRTNLAKANLYAGMSHDLKTPLNAILGYSEALAAGVLGEPDSDRYKDGAKRINAAGSQLLEEINKLIFRFANNDDDPGNDHGNADLGEILRESIVHSEPFATSAGHVLKTEIPDTTMPIVCNSVMMVQAISNLLSNAIKYTPAGGALTVRVTVTGDAYSISVSDTGIGMNEDELSLALQPFGRVSQSSQNHREGTGIGLSIVQEVVKQHNGQVEVESEPNIGTTITMKLPVIRRH